MTIRSLRRAVVRARQALRRGYAGLVGGGDGDEEAYAQLVLTVLREEGPLPLGPLIDHVARRAISGDRRAASEIDIGLWGEQVYHAKIVSVVRKMVGRTLALEGDASSPAVTPVSPAPPLSPAA
ncbi:MAG TPA: hypothetical protein VFN74_02925 [Chloroflexota bacterium]|jgi:hypothetical protein|nr:hypothetical protein [Chloroflexota bacterium]